MPQSFLNMTVGEFAQLVIKVQEETGENFVSSFTDLRGNQVAVDLDELKKPVDVKIRQVDLFEF